MSQWTTCSALIQSLEDEDDGLFMLQASLKNCPPDTRVKFFLDDKQCGVEFEDGKKLIYGLYPDYGDEFLESDRPKSQPTPPSKLAIKKMNALKKRSNNAPP